MSEHEELAKGSGVSRRGFLKGIGVGTVATGLLSPVGLKEAIAKEGAVVGPEEIPITLKVNGQNRKLKVEPRVTLLDALRNRLDITGAKKVCDRGTCGACTVMIDGNPVYSCSVLAIEAQGRDITTIESLSNGEHFDPVINAFVNNDAQQCGFCTPGFVVACRAFLNKHPHPTLEQVKKGLGGNLCRCGTYHGVEKAVLEASGGGAGAKRATSTAPGRGDS